jgi:hypothetical protein
VDFLPNSVPHWSLFQPLSMNFQFHQLNALSVQSLVSVWLVDVRMYHGCSSYGLRAVGFSYFSAPPSFRLESFLLGHTRRLFKNVFGYMFGSLYCD